MSDAPSGGWAASIRSLEEILDSPGLAANDRLQAQKYLALAYVATGEGERALPLLKDVVRSGRSATLRLDSLDLGEAVPAEVLRYVGRALIEVEEESPPIESRQIRQQARQIQEQLMTAAQIGTEAFDITVVHLMAEPVGGNFIRHRRTEEDRIVVYLADVTGRGLKAAVAAHAFGTALDVERLHGEALDVEFTHLNQYLNSAAAPGVVALGLLDLDPTAQTAGFVNAGLPPLLHYVAAADSVAFVAPGTLALGVGDAASPYELTTSELRTGDYLVLCSDALMGPPSVAVTDTTSGGILASVIEGFRQGLSAQELADLLVAAAEFRRPLTDDVSCFVLRSGVVTVALPGGSSMEMVWIPPGRFAMGRMKQHEQILRAEDLWSDAFVNEYPAHEVTLRRGFYLGKYEVTQEQWAAVMGANPSRYTGPQHPVESVSWYEVQEYIHRLNEAAGDSLYRLPSEAEWEYASRAEATSVWVSGNEVSRVAGHGWYEGNNSPYGTKPVGTKEPNAWGLFDMAGNVWEWCQDRWLREYTMQSQVDPRGPEEGRARIIRGGGFGSDAGNLRPASRGGQLPHRGYDNVGFRLLMQRPAQDQDVSPATAPR